MTLLNPVFYILEKNGKVCEFLKIFVNKNAIKTVFIVVYLYLWNFAEFLGFRAIGTKFRAFSGEICPFSWELGKFDAKSSGSKRRHCSLRLGHTKVSCTHNYVTNGYLSIFFNHSRIYGVPGFVWRGVQQPEAVRSDREKLV
jgi:hypothetical protein